MNDLISRQALCDYALNQRDKTITPNDIMRFPAADRWIPVTERLPEEAKEVLVTVRDLAESTTFVELAYLCHLGIFIATEDMTYLWSEDGYEVLAWQPLPEPYKGGEE